MFLCKDFHYVLAIFLIGMVKYLTGSNVREKIFTLTYRSKNYSPSWWGWQQQKAVVVVHVQEAENI